MLDETLDLSKMDEIDFVVLKINGVSVQQFSKDEAVQTFLKSNDPIQIEVQQLQTTSNSSRNDADNKKLPLVLTLRCLTVSSADCMKSIQTQETQTNEQEQDVALPVTIADGNNDRLIEEEHVLFDQCLAPEIDIEEITLRKSNSNELLGLSIIYSGADSGSKTNSGGSNNGGGSGSDNNNDICTEVYISNIQKDSVADRDGRLRQGDQILQINGKDVKTKEETETLMAENNNAVTLLVSRYIYTDEDDFNDPSMMVDLEVEEIGEENDETDEDEGDDLYVDNHTAYENCLTVNDNMHLVSNLDQVFLAQEKCQNDKAQEVIETNLVAEKVITDMTKVTAQKYDETNDSKFVSTDKMQKNYKTHNKDSEDNSGKNVTILDVKEQRENIKNERCNDKSLIDSDTEHIYETIPEDSETEPLYCSPYESSTYVNAIGTCSSNASTNGGIFHLQQRQKQRVAQWLGLCTTSSINATLFPRKTIPMRGVARKTITPKDNSVARCSNKSDTVRSIATIATNCSSSSGGGVDIMGLSNHQEEQDNSSSAYNTGGSNASANQIRNESLTLAHNIQEEGINTPLMVRTITKRSSLLKDKEKCSIKTTNIGTHCPNKANTNIRSGCDELSIPDTLIRMYPPLITPQSGDKKHSTKESLPQTCSKHHPTQPNNLPRAVSMLCPNFTAPNLRQYRFVSSQEVSALQPISVTNEETRRAQPEPSQQQKHQQPTMVWKVKRRPDGTRYIVRRPAVTVMNGTAPVLTLTNRSRGLRNPEHIRHDATTTEDDTVSEIKTGRYWSKEERKKHVERARERRLQQLHLQQQQLQFEKQMLEGAMCISDKMIAHRKQRQKQQVLKVQQQDLQFGGSAQQKLATTQAKASTTMTTPCDLQTVLGVKQQPVIVKSYNNIALQQQYILNPNQDLQSAQTISAEENDFSEKCSSP